MRNKVTELPKPKMTKWLAWEILRRRFTDEEIVAMVNGRMKVTRANR